MKSGIVEYRKSTLGFSKCRKRVLRLSLRDVSKATGIHWSNIHRMEHGRKISVIDYLTLQEWMYRKLIKTNALR